MNCSDVMINQPDSPMQPQVCTHVIGAKFCIKSTAMNGEVNASIVLLVC